MNQKNYRVINTHDYKAQNMIVHEYDIVVDMNNNGHEVITLKRSQDDVWASDRRGEEVLSLIDTGDMIIYPKKMYAGDVDYAQHAELFILLSFLNKTEHMPLYQGVIEEVPTKTYDI
jgi:hypothetical protein